MKVNKLKGKIVERGMNIESLAKMIGVDRATLYRKLNDAEKITIGEAAKIKDALEISESDAYDIFLA